MLTSDYLPATRPLLANLQDCDAWLSSATLAEPGRACSTISGLLDDLEDAPPGHVEYLRILERLRGPAMDAIAEQLKWLAGKPLPLSVQESGSFQAASVLAQALFLSYHRLLRASLRGTHPELEHERARLATRTLEAGSLDINLHCLAKQAVDGSRWRRLHEAYALAERHGIANTPADERHQRETATTAYLKILLVMLAAPQGMTARELQWLQRWARRWAHKVTLLRESRRTAHYAVDLGGELPPAWRLAADSGPTIRFLDTARLASSLTRRAKLLLLGDSPASLGMGKDCLQPAAGDLLSKLLRQWCSAPLTRQFPRRPAAAGPGQGGIDVGVGLAAVHECIAGKPFRDERRPWEYSRRNVDQIHIFRHDHGVSVTASDPSASIAERWIPVDESANGFCIRRNGRGARVVAGQLVCLRPHGATRFIVTEARWGLQSADDLMIGARALPGLAMAASARELNEEAQPLGSPFQALLLPVGEKLPSSLVVPSGRHRTGRLLELQTEAGQMKIRMKELLGRGYDYERASFDVVT
jgi:hypothetical protein